MNKRLTHAEIEAARTEKGGWTKAQLAKWGLPWPPPRGWKDRLAGGPKPNIEQERNRRVRKGDCKGCAWCDVWRPAMKEPGLREPWQTCANEISPNYRKLVGYGDKCPEYYRGAFGTKSAIAWAQHRGRDA